MTQVIDKLDSKTLFKSKIVLVGVNTPDQLTLRNIQLE